MKFRAHQLRLVGRKLQPYVLAGAVFLAVAAYVASNRGKLCGGRFVLAANGARRAPGGYWSDTKDGEPLKARAINDVFYRQGISSTAFHSPLFKLRLAKMVTKHNRVAVVGVEGGSEVLQFLNAGYEVYAVDAITAFLRTVRALAGANPLLHTVHLAVSKYSTGKMNITYQDHSELVQVGRIADHIREPLDVLSVDIQGESLNAAQAADLGAVRSMWIEIYPWQYREIEKLFEELHRAGFMIFDFVPWGTICANKYDPKIRGSKYYGSIWRCKDGRWKTRPHNPSPAEYARWFRDLAADKPSDKFMQTDFVAIRKEIVSEKFFDALSVIGNDVLSDIELVRRNHKDYVSYKLE